MKPRIWLGHPLECIGARRWKCTNGIVTGWGETPKAAFRAWEDAKKFWQGGNYYAPRSQG